MKREGGVDAGVSITYEVPLPPPYSIKLVVPWINYKIGEIGAYIELGAGLQIGGKIEYKKRNDKKTFEKTKSTVELTLSGGVELGAKVDILPEVKAVTFDIKIYGKASLVGQGKLEFKTNGTIEFKPEVYFEPLVGGFSGNIKAGDVTIFKQSYEWRLLDKIMIYGE